MRRTAANITVSIGTLKRRSRPTWSSTWWTVILAKTWSSKPGSQAGKHFQYLLGDDPIFLSLLIYLKCWCAIIFSSSSRSNQICMQRRPPCTSISLLMMPAIHEKTLTNKKRKSSKNNQWSCWLQFSTCGKESSVCKRYSDSTENSQERARFIVLIHTRASGESKSLLESVCHDLSDKWRNNVVAPLFRSFMLFAKKFSSS